MNKDKHILVSPPINHFPVVLYDKDFHCTDLPNGIKYHITEHTDIYGISFSNEDKIPKVIEFTTYEGFVVLHAPCPIDIYPITVILYTREEQDTSKKTYGFTLMW